MAGRGGRGEWHAPQTNKPAAATGRDTTTRTVVASNRRARFDYAIEDVFEAGLVLTGTEVKSLRQGRASLVDGFAEVERGEAWLEAVHIPEYTEGTWTNHEPRRRRKLLLHAAEIDKLAQAAGQSGYTLVPLQLYFRGGRAKVEIGVAKGKKTFDKRQALRNATDEREAQRAMRQRTRIGE
jgi:SsrA-binding protein